MVKKEECHEIHEVHIVSQVKGPTKADVRREGRGTDYFFRQNVPDGPISTGKEVLFTLSATLVKSRIPRIVPTQFSGIIVKRQYVMTDMGQPIQKFIVHY